MPGVVRERETRRIFGVEQKPNGTLLRVEDFFGHEQYGIESNRVLSADYRPGDEVLIVDGVHDARSSVLLVDDEARTVLVTSLESPKGGWRLEYGAPLPKEEIPSSPGLFPPGGCYLQKLDPPGTPHYYWGRVHKEWDIAVRRYHRRFPGEPPSDRPGAALGSRRSHRGRRIARVPRRRWHRRRETPRRRSRPLTAGRSCRRCRDRARRWWFVVY